MKDALNPIMKDNAYFMILEASPERYIRRPSTAMLVLLRLIEGAAAGWLVYCGGSFVAKGFYEWFSGGDISLDEFLRTLLPKDLPGIPETVSQLTGEGDLSLQELIGEGTIASALVTAFAVCVMLLLVGTVLDTLALTAVWAISKGAIVSKYVHKAMRWIWLVLLVANAGLAGFIAKSLITSGISFGHLVTGALSSGDVSEEEVAQLTQLVEGLTEEGILEMVGALRMLMLLAAFCIVFAFFRIGYQRNITAIMTAVDFETRLKFKETALSDINLPKYLYVFGVLFLAAGGLCFWKLGFQNVLFGVLFLEFLKILLIADCWGNFRRCHM